MNILVLNTGSSSIKYQLLEMETETLLSSGLVEKIGEPMGRVVHKVHLADGRVQRVPREEPIPNHRQGMALVVDLLIDPETGVIDDPCQIEAIGHRVVHGGEMFSEPTQIDPEVIEGIRANVPLAPLHNPGHLAGIETALELFPGAYQVAVFDTAFHQTMPPAAFHYAVPYHLYENLGVRRYGFHGTSHRFVTHQAARMLDIPLERLNLISLHLGNGASVTAVEGGRSVDTSMGMTPLEGVVMGTRSGSLDPAIIGYLSQRASMPVDEVMDMLTKESGLKGICGCNDLRDIHEHRAHGDHKAQLALEILVHSYRKHVGSCLAVLGRADALVFTAGIGENDPVVRSMVCAGLEGLGIHLDSRLNLAWRGSAGVISREDSPVKVLVIPTNEELEIARQTMQVLDQRFGDAAAASVQ